jgi:hypothetical protein
MNSDEKKDNNENSTTPSSTCDSPVSSLVIPKLSISDNSSLPFSPRTNEKIDSM